MTLHTTVEHLTQRGNAPVGFGVSGSTCATGAESPDNTVVLTAQSVNQTTKPVQFSVDKTKDLKYFYSPLPDGIVQKHVDIDALEFYLKGHPDQQIVQYVLTGLRAGFDLGFNGARKPVFRNNNKSARENPIEVTKAIQKELARGHTAGPFPFPPFPVNQVSPLGATPKPDGSYRLVLDLSQPDCASVNDGIDKTEFPTEYTHFDKATDMVRRLGKGCKLCKIDINDNWTTKIPIFRYFQATFHQPTMSFTVEIKVSGYYGLILPSFVELFLIVPYV